MAAQLPPSDLLVWFVPGGAAPPVLRAVHLVPSLHKYLYHTTVSQQTSPLLRAGVGSATDSCCEQEKTRLAIPSGQQGSRGAGEQGSRGCGSHRHRGLERHFAPVPNSTVHPCIFLCCRLLRNVSWPLCPIAEGDISPA